VALAIGGAALQVDGNPTDRYTLEVVLYKATTWANSQQGECDMLGLIQQTVMNSSRTHHPCPTADCDWLAVQISLSPPQQFTVSLSNVQ